MTLLHTIATPATWYRPARPERNPAYLRFLRSHDTDYGRVVEVDDEDPNRIIYVIQSEQGGGRHVTHDGTELEAIR
jgi:hypothetical protein